MTTHGTALDPGISSLRAKRCVHVLAYEGISTCSKFSTGTIADKPSTWICEGCGVTVLRQRFAIFGGIALVQPAQRRRGNPVAQLVNVHSILRLNYETLSGLISLASPPVAKLTHYATRSRTSLGASSRAALMRHPSHKRMEYTALVGISSPTIFGLRPDRLRIRCIHSRGQQI